MHPPTLRACALVIILAFVGVRSESGDGWNVEDDDGSAYDDYRPRRRPNAKTGWMFPVFNYKPMPPPLPRPDDMTRQVDYISRFNGIDTIRAEVIYRVRQFVAERTRFRFEFRRESPTARPTVDPNYSTRYDFSGLASDCPPGFEYVSLARSCYKVVYEEHSWTSADQRCRVFHDEAHLVAITTSDENSALKTYLREQLAKNSNTTVCQRNSLGKLLWTSGRQMSETSCEERFVWKVMNYMKPTLSFTHWRPKEPNCSGDCIHLLPTDDFLWNDINCSEMLCPLCEYDPK